MIKAFLSLLWSIASNASSISNVAVLGDLLVIVSQTGDRNSPQANLLAIDGRNREKRWLTNLGNHLIGGIANSRGQSDARLYLTASNPDFFRAEVFVYCYQDNGHQQWQWQSEAHTISAPAFYSGDLYFTIDSQILICLEAATGLERLHVKLDLPASFAAPVCQNETVIIPGSGPYILGINKISNHQWQYRASGAGWFDKTPVITGGNVCAVSSRGTAVSLDMSSGKPHWQRQIGSIEQVLSAPTAHGPYLFVGAHDGLHALRVEDGQSIWSFPTKRHVTASPTFSNDVVYFASNDRNLYALGVDNGEEIWRYRMERRISISPQISRPNDLEAAIVYAADQSGKIVALQEKRISQTALKSSDKTIRENKDIKETTKKLESDGEFAQAAEMWFAVGNLEQAARLFELAGQWKTAAELWRRLGRLLKYAQTLEGQAHNIEDENGKLEDRVAAWEKAAKSYESLGETTKAEFCKLQVAKYKKQPVLDLSIEHDGLLHHVWSKLRLTVSNVGYGRAYRIEVQASGEQFVGQVTTSEFSFRLLPGKEISLTLSIRPLQYGVSVPMLLNLKYLDSKDQPHELEKTIFVPVARDYSQRVTGQIKGVFTSSVFSEGALRTSTSPSEINLVDLRRNIVIFFNKNELFDLCFELGIDVDELIHDRKSEFAKEIILYLDRRNRLEDLVSYCEQIRPHVDW